MASNSTQKPSSWSLQTRSRFSPFEEPHQTRGAMTPADVIRRLPSPPADIAQRLIHAGLEFYHLQDAFDRAVQIEPAYGEQIRRIFQSSIAPTAVALKAAPEPFNPDMDELRKLFWRVTIKEFCTIYQIKERRQRAFLLEQEGDTQNHLGSFGNTYHLRIERFDLFDLLARAFGVKGYEERRDNAFYKGIRIDWRGIPQLERRIEEDLGHMNEIPVSVARELFTQENCRKDFEDAMDTYSVAARAYKMPPYRFYLEQDDVDHAVIAVSESRIFLKMQGIEDSGRWRVYVLPKGKETPLQGIKVRDGFATATYNYLMRPKVRVKGNDKNEEKTLDESSRETMAPVTFIVVDCNKQYYRLEVLGHDNENAYLLHKGIFHRGY